MEGIKEYPQPAGTVLNAIHDIIEIQNARVTFSDIPGGKINFIVKLYANQWEHQLTVTGISENLSNVKIAIIKGTRSGENQLRREFALLDSMLAEEQQYQIVNKE